MSFDWSTFALQLVNVVILLAILRHFLFRPVAAIIARRRDETRAALAAADMAKAAAGTAASVAKAEAAASIAARQELLQKAAAEAEVQRVKLLDAARAEAAKIVDEGRAARTREAAAADARALAQAQDLAAAIAARAIAAQPATVAGYIDRLGAALAAMDVPRRQALLGDTGLALIFASPPQDADLDAARRVLARFGAQASIGTDPALIAGVELRAGGGVLHNSLAHDLVSLSKAMHDVR